VVVNRQGNCRNRKPHADFPIEIPEEMASEENQYRFYELQDLFLADR